MDSYEHIPVLLNEVLEYLAPKPGQSIIDATLGGGGYSRAILEKIGNNGKLLSIDLDQDAVENFKLNIFTTPSANASTPPLQEGNTAAPRITIAQGNFGHIDHIVRNHKFPAPDGIVADLGLSSYELDQSGRGISFQKKEPLDMRFDQHGNTADAKFILNSYDIHQLENIFNKYGEEKFSRQITRKIQEARIKSQIHYTTDLYQIIVDALPKPVKHKADDSARRIFQALRIEVNHELSNLEEFLPKAFNLLSPGGRLVVVSFHSLEDRIVKQFFVGLTKGCICPPDFPQCICGKDPQGKILTKKVVVASDRELKENPRSRPAKLRAIIKL